MALISLVSKSHFYQQVRLLLRKLRDGTTPDATLLDEKLRMTSTLSLNAPDGEVENIQQASEHEPVAVSVWHNGLTGAMGALPVTYSEWMIERQYRYGDSSAKAFIDQFSHRLYCLDYLAWQKNHLCALAESQDQLPLQTPVLALTGLLNTTQSSELTQHAPLFASPVRSMINLERWLQQRFGVPAQIIPFTGGWRTVPNAERCQLGHPQHRLATAPMLGTARLEVHAQFDVVLGPMTPETSRRFTPQGSAWRELWTCIADYVGPVMDFSVSLTINSADLVPQPLGQRVLGQDLCLGSNAVSALHQIRLSAPTITTG